MATFHVKATSRCFYFIITNYVEGLFCCKWALVAFGPGTSLAKYFLMFFELEVVIGVGLKNSLNLTDVNHTSHPKCQNDI